MLLSFNILITIAYNQDKWVSYSIGDNSNDLDKISNTIFQSHNHIMNSPICKLVNKYELHFQGVNFVNFKLFVSVLTEHGVSLD